MPAGPGVQAPEPSLDRRLLQSLSLCKAASNICRYEPWLLPERGSPFDFPSAPPCSLSSANDQGLFVMNANELAWSEANWERQKTRRSERSWWLIVGELGIDVVEARLRNATDAITGSIRAVIDQFGFSNLRSVLLGGSYLWAADSSSSIDLIAVVDVDPESMGHFPSLDLTTGNESLQGLDLLVISSAALEDPDTLRGDVDVWEVRPGIRLPYDNSFATIAKAIRVTSETSFCVFGADLTLDFQVTSADRLRLAYYFAQEASALISHNVLPYKAVQRLLESNLILDLCDGQREYANQISDVSQEALHCAKLTRSMPRREAAYFVQGSRISGRADVGSSLLNRTVERFRATETMLPARQCHVSSHTPVVSALLSESMGVLGSTEELTSFANRLLSVCAGEPLAGWERLRTSLQDAVLLKDLLYLDSLLTTSTSIEALRRTPRPECVRHAPKVSTAVSDQQLARACAWAVLGDRLLAEYRQGIKIMSPVVLSTWSCLRDMIAISRFVLGDNPQARIGVFWTKGME